MTKQGMGFRVFDTHNHGGRFGSGRKDLFLCDGNWIVQGQMISLIRADTIFGKEPSKHFVERTATIICGKQLVGVSRAVTFVKYEKPHQERDDMTMVWECVWHSAAPFAIKTDSNSNDLGRNVGLWFARQIYKGELGRKIPVPKIRKVHIQEGIFVPFSGLMSVLGNMNPAVDLEDVLQLLVRQPFTGERRTSIISRDSDGTLLAKNGSVLGHRVDTILVEVGAANDIMRLFHLGLTGKIPLSRQ